MSDDYPDDWPMRDHCGCIHDPEGRPHECEGTRTEGYTNTIVALRAQVAQHEANANRAMAECQALVAKLADCQAVIRSRGHAADCPINVCITCGRQIRGGSGFDARLHYCRSQGLHKPGSCSDACGHDRTTGEKA